MLKRKKLWSLIAAALLVTACGGGGGDGKEPALGGSGGADDVSGGNPPNSNPPSNNLPDTNPPVGEQQLNGNLHFNSNQLAYIKAGRTLEDREAGWDRDAYDAADLEAFEQGWGTARIPIEVADGFTREDDANPRVVVKPDPKIFAPAAPIASLGFKVIRQVLSDSDTAISTGQTAVGRVAFQFAERSDSPALQTGQAESIKLVIDKVQLSTDGEGKLVGAQVLSGAQMHVSAVVATPQGMRTINGTINDLPTETVHLLDLSQVLDGDDTNSIGLIINLEQAFSKADATFDDLGRLKGYFDVDVTMSALSKFIRPSGDANLERRELTGKPIQVGSQPVVNGAGVSVRLHVRAGE
jgi:hypothetical protein